MDTFLPVLSDLPHPVEFSRLRAPGITNCRSRAWKPFYMSRVSKFLEDYLNHGLYERGGH